MRTKKISFFLASKKGFEILKMVVELNGDVVGQVVSVEDSYNHNRYYDQIKKLSKDYGINFFNVKDDYNVNFQLSIAISWPYIIEAKPNSLIVLHDSLLPKYRGFSPLVSALVNGDEEVGVSAFFANKDYDSGALIGLSKTKISYPIKILDAIDLVIENYKLLLFDILDKFVSGKEIESFEQCEENVTYSLWRDEKDYYIEWNKTSSEIQRFVNAVGAPYSGAATYLGNRIVRILDVEVLNDVYIVNRSPGKVIFLKDGCPVVVCGEGLLKILNAYYEDTKISILPLNKLKIRFSFNSN